MNAITYYEFIRQIEVQNGVLLDSEWKGRKSKYKIRCKYNHISYVTADSVIRRGARICSECIKQNQIDKVWYEFIDRVTEQGGMVIENKWLGSNIPHHIRCSYYHDGYPRPSAIAQGQGICFTCAGNNPKVAENDFKNALIRMGATLIDTEWYGTKRQYKTICINNHICMARPDSVQMGRGICSKCANNNTVQSRDTFYKILNANGAIYLDDAWWGVKNHYLIECALGHIRKVIAQSIILGRPICTECYGKIYDVIYVITNSNDIVKFGVTNSNSNRRFMTHKLNGYSDVLLNISDLPFNIPFKLERGIKSYLGSLGYRPVKGYEYYPIECTNYIITYINDTIRKDSKINV